MKLLIQKLVDAAEVPVQGTSLAAGFDLVSVEDVMIEKGKRKLVGTGLAMAIQEGFEGQIRPRSGNAFKHGLTVLNTPGTIDADYRGEVKVLLYNTGQFNHIINKGDRIAQIVFQKVEVPVVSVVDELPETVRGDGGFGSTGD